ncbi:hypothetical protein KUTeg_013845 [Tegillarca granosa]|uniref:Uncharacterized protein n=1 Tax=Tegillarca granosa TaxID=220873 RepID=A0ABQ9EXB8_TEGGR|nr:hypothetical protein KUTeg_013845 [Tegillarca granosa]
MNPPDGHIPVVKEGYLWKRDERRDEVAHTLTENRVLQTTKHPFLTFLKRRKNKIHYLQSVLKQCEILSQQILPPWKPDKCLDI